MTRQQTWTAIALFAATATTLNAFWMLAHPPTWYRDLPAAVPDFGAFNEHFVRDIGCAYATVAVSLWWAIRRPDYRFPLCMIAAIFLVGHAVIHVFDTARGAVGADHWWIDLPGVYAPAVAILWLVFACRPSRITPAKENPDATKTD